MTDAVETPVAETPETAEAPATTARRGRPRPQATIERDMGVLEKIADSGSTREELVQSTGLAAPQVYLSLYRLRQDGKVERNREGSSHKWVRKSADSAGVAESEIPEPATFA
jgi:predicted Rossmann fold nucleotide-binding protein DprA/Smf involved in DNA uptake